MIISGYSFEGPYVIGKKVVSQAAVYVILDVDKNVIDVGQSGETGVRLLTHERKSCWDRYGGKWFGVKWMPSDKYTIEDRKELESSIRKPETPCGKR